MWCINKWRLTFSTAECLGVVQAADLQMDLVSVDMDMSALKPDRVIAKGPRGEVCRKSAMY